ncbi:MAG TPA: CHAT domain-containing protein, partial [Gemmatimonadaceae bacterium]|nr:CHAT domain-containing protein [Gemmatimonadaceae bacterium]
MQYSAAVARPNSVRCKWARGCDSEIGACHPHAPRPGCGALRPAWPQLLPVSAPRRILSLQMSDVPVIFLAFANDRSRPLETLDRERKSIQRALEPLTANRRWELRVEPNATLDDITQIFQSAEFRNRVAIFHYAGHAADDALSLATDTGTNAPARSSGLARFLAEQRGLELVVLNGCRTRGQATSLLDAGVSHVVATSVSIDDAAATQFATGFYRGLAGGATLASSFREALAILETSGVPRSAARSVPSHRGSAVEEAPLSSESTWWELYPGESAANAWTLAEVERDPYFGLPPLEDAPLPAAPFVEYLARFERRHAAIFFGRGDEVRSLYRALTDKNTPAIHLLYGQSGVGKSSLLEAGLLPRLGAGSDAHEVVYCRRRADLGCLGTVLDVIPASSEAKAKAKAKDLHAAWLERESASSRPITIIIDQVEEAFTAPRAAGGAAELLELLEAVAGTFSGGNTNTRPRGKLVLGFRKEWLAEIVGRLKDAQVPYSATFVEPLKAQGIIEAIEGPSRSQRLRSFYNLSVAPGLASIIAEDLREDQGSPIAPVLQILLWRMWNAAKRASEGAPTFDTATYQELRKNGLLLDDFFSGQVAAIDQWKPELVQSGFVLDYLREHTTDLGTAAERTTAQLAELYPHRAPELDEIRERMVGTYHLLVEPPGESRESSARATRLSHDTLAPLVRQRFDASTAPGQRARRLLENRQADWGGGRSTGEVKAAELEKPREDQMASAVLDDLDLTQVERGQAGMRGWTKSERRLVEASRAARAVRQKRQRQIRILGSIAAVLILAFGIGMWAQYREARRSAQEASARSLLAEARNVVRDDIGGALLLAVAAMQEGGSWLEFQNGLRSI